MQTNRQAQAHQMLAIVIKEKRCCVWCNVQVWHFDQPLPAFFILFIYLFIF